MQKWKLLVKIVNYLKLVKEINVKYLLLKKKKSLTQDKFYEILKLTEIRKKISFDKYHKKCLSWEALQNIKWSLYWRNSEHLS